jgi:hypothetical protein
MCLPLASVGDGFHSGEHIMLSTILIILLILILLGAVPAWPHSRNWGYAPSGSIGLVLVIVLILALLRHI